ncbi:MAG: hypothetical protein WC746_05875 [archaeon]|jgi:hypothetical protein
MGLFDFLKGKKKEEPVHGRKKDLGVCVPHHAKSLEEKKKLSKSKYVSPFDKLRMDHLKETADFNKEFKEISEQESEEPYEYEPDLGVESIDTRKAQALEEEKPKLRRLDMLKPGQRDDDAPVENKSNNSKIEYNQSDELDVASEKMSNGYVPKFSSTARKKLGLEEAAPVKVSVSGTIEVSGVYVGAETMISGTVVSGRIRKSMSAQLGKGTVRISDLKQGSRTVSELNSGEEGTIFVRGNAMSVKYGDVIDFS